MVLTLIDCCVHIMQGQGLFYNQQATTSSPESVIRMTVSEVELLAGELFVTYALVTTIELITLIKLQASGWTG